MLTAAGEVPADDLPLCGDCAQQQQDPPCGPGHGSARPGHGAVPKSRHTLKYISQGQADSFFVASDFDLTQVSVSQRSPL